MWRATVKRARCNRLTDALSLVRSSALKRRRWYTVIHNPFVEEVNVTCGSSGEVTLNIYDSTPRSRNSAKPIILTLTAFDPSTSPYLSPSPPSPPPALLSLLPDTTIIQILPRWSSPIHFFPQPLHDVLTAYDWIVNNLLPENESAIGPPFAVYGSRLGGTLATSLALTESRPGRRGRITAFATTDAVFDWTAVATSKPPLLPQDGGEEELDPDLLEMYDLRSKLFSSPGACFDAFASPVLFFRNAGLKVPAVFPSHNPPSTPSSASFQFDDIEVLPETEAGPRPTPFPDPEEADEAAAIEKADEEETLPSIRRSHLHFPAKHSGLKIPFARIGVSSSSRNGILGVQAHNLATLMRRSVMLHEMKERVQWDLGMDPVAETERRVDLVEVVDEGVVAEGEGERDVKWAAEFFRDVL